MPGSDPMSYTMEQLVNALAVETMSEISLDESEVEEFHKTEEQAPGMWEQIAEVVLEELEILFDDEPIYPYGHKAVEAIDYMRPLLEPYSVYPACHKLLSAIENNAANKLGKDPRPYISLVIRIFDNDHANDWKNKREIQ